MKSALQNKITNYYYYK